MSNLKKIYTSIDELKTVLFSEGKIVFTNGCFDILHLGHVDLLTKAKSKGDLLVVGINTDDSIKRLKGAKRPVFNLKYRMQMLEALQVVDFIIPFDEDTPLNLITRLSPNVLVKGGDYNVDTIVGAKEVQQRGGKIEIIKFVYDISSSSILDKLKNIENENS